MDNLTVSISQLKIRPAKVIAQADDYPLVIKKRNQVKGYLLGKELFEKIITYIEDYIDKKAVKETNFRQGRRFEEVVEELGL